MQSDLTTRRRRPIINIVLFQSGWWACVFLSSLVSPFILLILLLIHLVFFSFNPLKETLLVFAVGVIGTLIDSTLMNLNVLEFPSTEFTIHNSLCPTWLSLLWMLFACTLYHSLFFLNNRIFLSMILGSIGATLSYIAGASFQKLTFLPVDIFISIPGEAILAIVWLPLLPVFFGLLHYLPSTERNSE